jgi:hypothetical protein
MTPSPPSPAFKWTLASSRNFMGMSGMGSRNFAIRCMCLLCTALALCWDDAQAPYPIHTLVNQCVEAARKMRHTQAQSGFINACLRRFMRERDSLVQRASADPQAQWNHPQWWIGRLQAEHPAHWQHMLHSLKAIYAQKMQNDANANGLMISALLKLFSILPAEFNSKNYKFEQYEDDEWDDEDPDDGYFDDLFK